MSNENIFSKNLLELKVLEEDNSICVKFRGKSVDRDPSDFITPVLSETIENCLKKNKKLVLDFQELEFMSSSTITPVSKIIEIGRDKSVKITVVYQKALKWQDLNFSALRIFESDDGLIEIAGK